MIERSPNTVKAYAHDLKDWFVFLADRGVGLAAGPAGGRRASSSPGCGCRRRPATGGWRCCRRWQAHCSESTVNRKLSAVSAFYQHAARHGVELGELLRTLAARGPSRVGVAAVPASHQQVRRRAAAGDVG